MNLCACMRARDQQIRECNASWHLRGWILDRHRRRCACMRMYVYGSCVATPTRDLPSSWSLGGMSNPISLNNQSAESNILFLGIVYRKILFCISNSYSQVWCTLAMIFWISIIFIIFVASLLHSDAFPIIRIFFQWSLSLCIGCFKILKLS